MKKILISVATLLVVSGCATLKTPQINGTDKKEGLIDFSFTYGVFERPKVNWTESDVSATQQCLAWGYRNPSTNSDAWQECISTDNRGNCNSHRVTKRYQCGLSSEEAETQRKLLAYIFSKKWSWASEVAIKMFGGKCGGAYYRFSEENGEALYTAPNDRLARESGNIRPQVEFDIKRDHTITVKQTIFFQTTRGRVSAGDVLDQRTITLNLLSLDKLHVSRERVSFPEYDKQYHEESVLKPCE